MSISRLKTRGEVPPPVCYHTCSMDEKTRMFCIGGVKSSGGIFSDPYMIDMKTFTWKPLKFSLPFEFDKHSTVYHGGFFYTYASDGYMYKLIHEDVDGLMIVQKLPLNDPKPIPRTEHTATVVTANDEPWMLVFGGRAVRKNMTLPDLWGFNLNTETWKRIGSLKARAGHIAHLDVDSNRVVIFGGLDGKGVYSDTVFHIDCNNNFKRTIVKCSGTLPSPRAFPGSAIFEGRICLFGGLTDDGPCSDCYALDFRTHKWHILSKKLGPFRLGHQCFVVGDFMYSFGGKTDPNSPKVSGDFLKIKIKILVSKFAKREVVDVKKELVSKVKAPTVTQEAPAPVEQQQEAPAPVVKEPEPPAPVVKEPEPPAPVVKEPEPPAPVVKEPEPPAPVVKEPEPPAPVKVIQPAQIRGGGVRRVGQGRGVRRAVRRSRGVRRVARGGRGVRRVRRARGVRRVVRGGRGVRRVRARGVRRVRSRARGVRRVVRGGRGVRRVRGRAVRRVRRGVRRGGGGRVVKPGGVALGSAGEAERQSKIQEMKRKKEALMKEQQEKKLRIQRMREEAELEMKRRKDALSRAREEEERKEQELSEKRRLAEIERKKQIVEERKKREENRRRREEEIKKLEVDRKMKSEGEGGAARNASEGEIDKTASAVPDHMKKPRGRERSRTHFKQLFSGVGIQVLPTTKKFVVEVEEMEKEVEEEMKNEQESKIEIVEEHKRYGKVQTNGFRRFVMGHSLLRTFVTKPKEVVERPKGYLEYLKNTKNIQETQETEWPLKKEEPWGLFTSKSLIPKVKSRSKIIQAFKNEAKEYPKIDRMGFLPYCEPFRKRKVTKREKPELYIQYKLSIGQEVEKEDSFEELFNYSVTHLKPIAINVQKKEKKTDQKKNIAKKKLQQRRNKRKIDNVKKYTKNFVEARLDRAAKGEKLTLAKRPKRKGGPRRRRTKKPVSFDSLNSGI